MNATELRIGSIVFYNSEDDKNEPVKYFCPIDGEDLRIMQDDENYLKSHEPIALTPAVLDKIKYLPYPIKIIGTHRVGIELLGCRLPACYEYLHQLQNLVFALTGEELEINLEEK